MRVPHSVTGRTGRVNREQSFVRNASSAGTASQAALASQMGQAAGTLGEVGGFFKKQAETARRFGVLQSFSSFQTAVDTRFEEMKRAADPAQANFSDEMEATYNNMETEWLSNVPDEFHDEFKTRATDVRQNLQRASREFQFARTDEFFRQGVTDAVDTALTTLDQDGSLASLDQQRLLVDEYINSTALTEAEKVALRRKAYTAMESVSYKSEVRRGNLEMGALGVGSAPGTAADLILELDGASLENGLTYDENVELVNGRVSEAQTILQNEIDNPDLLAAYPPRVQAALISLVDDLGELPDSVKQAIATGDMNQVASAVAELDGDRRQAEAETILGIRNMPEGQLDADPRFANIPYEDRLALRADAEREAAAAQIDAAKVQKAAQDASINDLMVKLFDGEAGQHDIDNLREQGVLTDIEDIQKAQKLLDDRDNELRLIQDAQARLETGLTFNPNDEDHRKMLNALVGTEGLAAIQAGDKTYAETVLVPLVRQGGDIPTDVAGTLTGMLRSQDPLRATYALDLLSQLQQASPDGYQMRISDQVAGDVEYWQGIKDYYPQDEVLASIRGGTTQEERTRVKMLREEARELINDDEVNINVASRLGDMPGWRWGDPSVAPGVSQLLNRDFQQLFEREYARDGNLNAAQERALKAMSRVWRATDVGGQQSLMRYPPEVAGYETWNGSYDWITQQGRQELGLDDGATFQLISDEQTRTELEQWRGTSGPRPSYLVVYQDEEGNLVMPRDAAGQVQRISFEVTPEMEAEKTAMLNAAKEEQAYNDFMGMYNQALRHAQMTGTPVPADIQTEFNDWLERRPPKDSSLMVFDNWGDE